jgi:hypothetical protein
MSYPHISGIIGICKFLWECCNKSIIEQALYDQYSNKNITQLRGGELQTTKTRLRGDEFPTTKTRLQGAELEMMIDKVVCKSTNVWLFLWWMILLFISYSIYKMILI